MEQQTPIAAPHHTEAEAHEADRAITQVVAFPTALGHAGIAEQHAGDFAVARVLKPSVEGAQGEDEPVSASLRQRGRIGTGVAAGQASPEPDRGDRTDLEELVERQEDCGRVDAGLVNVDTKHGATMCDEVFRAISCDA